MTFAGGGRQRPRGGGSPRRAGAWSGGSVGWPRCARVVRTNRIFSDPVDFRVKAEQPARDADARTLRSARFQSAEVVAIKAIRRRCDEARFGIRLCDRRKQRSSIGDAACHWPSGVLRMRDRDDAGARHQANGRLQADEAIGIGRRDDRAIGLGADALALVEDRHEQRVALRPRDGPPVGVDVAEVGGAARKATKKEVSSYA